MIRCQLTATISSTAAELGRHYLNTLAIEVDVVAMIRDFLARCVRSTVGISGRHHFRGHVGKSRIRHPVFRLRVVSDIFAISRGLCGCPISLPSGFARMVFG